MTITAIEFKQNLDRYLKAVSYEDVCITKDGKVVAVLSSPNKNRIEIARSLIGSLPDDVTLDEAREEKLM